MKLRILLPLIAVAVLVVGAPAATASSTSNGYNSPSNSHSVPPPKTHVLGSQDSGGPSATPTAAAHATDGTGSLPFTGFDLLLVAGAGVVLLGMGLLLRRLTVSSEPLN